MKNDASRAQQHLADGFAGNGWGDWETKDDFIKDLQNKTNKWNSGNNSEVQSPRSVQTLRFHITRLPMRPTQGHASGQDRHRNRLVLTSSPFSILQRHLDQ
jgi:hypothetical protein